MRRYMGDAAKKIQDSIDDNSESVSENDSKIKIQNLTENPDPNQIEDDNQENGSNLNPSLNNVKEKVTNFLNDKQQSTLSLLTLSLAFTDDRECDENHHFIKLLDQTLTNDMHLVDACLLFEEKREALNLLLDNLETIEQQAAAIETLHFFLKDKKIDPASRQNTSLNYQNIQSKITSDDVLKDIVAFYLQLNLKKAKMNDSSADPEEIFLTLLPHLQDKYTLKEMIRSRYQGRWSTVLNKSQQQVLGIKKRLSILHAPFQTAHYSTHCLTQNKVIALLDQEIGFPKQLEEEETYTLLGAVGHASSADGQQTDAAEATYIKGLIERLKIQVNVKKFSQYVSFGLDELLAKVEMIELQHAIYYEALSVVVANLEIDDDEKILLDKIRDTFHIDEQKVIQMHTKYYLDSGLRGALDSLKNIPITESKNGCMHRLQEVLVEADLVPLKEMVPLAIQYLERIETVKLPQEAPTEVRMAVFSLVGNAMRLDNKFDDDEKKFLISVMNEFELSSDDLKSHAKIMKELNLKDLCKIIKSWARKHNQDALLPALVYYVLKAFAADGVIDPEEVAFKDLFFKELGLKAPPYARMLLRVVLEEVII